MSANHVMPPAGAGPTCAVFAPLLPLLSLDRLDAEEATAVRTHAMACATCGPLLAEYDALRAALRAALRSGELEESSHEMFRPPTVEKIMATKEPSASPTPIHSPERVSRRSTLLGSLAAVLVVTLLASVLFATHGFGGTALSGPTPTATTPLATTTTPPTSGLTQTTWTLTRFVVHGRDQLLVPSRAPTLRFGPHDGQFGGSGGCNGYSGEYTIAGETLYFNGVGFTQVACTGPGLGASLMEQENAYFHALPGVKRYHLDGNTLTLTLTLTSADGSVQLIFRAS